MSAMNGPFATIDSVSSDTNPNASLTVSAQKLEAEHEGA